MRTLRASESFPEIAARLAKGETLQSIANDFGVTREYIRQIAAAKGVTARSREARREARRERWQQMIDGGATEKDIATAEGISLVSVRQSAKQLGLYVPRYRRPPPDHGSRSRYQHHKCRCELCRQATREYQRARRQVVR